MNKNLAVDTVVGFEQSGHLANFEEPEASAKFCVRMKSEIEGQMQVRQFS